MSNPTSPNTPDVQLTFSRPPFDWEDIRKFFAPVLDDDQPTNDPNEPSCSSASEETAERR